MGKHGLVILVRNMELKRCSRCVMDGSDPDIVFEDGVCNHCHQAQKSLEDIDKEKHNLNKWLKKIKEEGCIIGLSGGVDSSATLHHLVKFGIKPICFSMDNAYNEEKADKNVEKMVKKLGLKHETVLIDMGKYRDLQSAFIRAGVSNIEIPTDHILMALTYKIAAEKGVKWVISGGNVATESIMPVSWSYSARDLTHIKDIFNDDLGSLPHCGLLKWNYYKWIKGIKIFYLLDYLGYNRIESEKMLEKEYGFQSTGEKHEENVFTKWFQNFYLFEKFGIDKRKAHYSSLINAGQMTRKEAIARLAERPVYPELGIEAKVMKYPRRSHSAFKQDKWFDRISKVIKYAR